MLFRVVILPAVISYLAVLCNAEARRLVPRAGPSSTCLTTSISVTTTTYTVPANTITQTTSITEPPSTVTETSTATATATTTTVVSSDCDLPPPTYDMGTCTYEPTVYFVPDPWNPVLYLSSIAGGWIHYGGNGIFNWLCVRLQNCSPPQSTLDRCNSAMDAALAASTPQEAADIWNSIMAPCDH